jgi:D-tyrosyl-tRNA(Tyr) deacylase
MRAVACRVARAAVTIGKGERRETGPGLLVLLGVGPQDSEAQAERLAAKLLELRVFSNAEGKFDHSVRDVKGELLVVSQFTLYGSVKGGRRPDFTGAAKPAQAEPLYRRFCALLAASGLRTVTGEFGAHMDVESVNDGPVTLLLDTDAF